MARVKLYIALFSLISASGCWFGQHGFCDDFDESASVCAQTAECSPGKLGCECSDYATPDSAEDTLVPRFPVPKKCLTAFDVSACCITLRDLRDQCEDYSDFERYCAERRQCDKTNNILVSSGENCE